MATHLVIANPTAGRWLALKETPRAARLLREHNISFDLVYTAQPQHAVSLTRQGVRAGYEVIVALGGDGTANEVLNGLVQARRAGEGEAALGFLCIGTGNDFAYGVGAPLDLEGGVEALARGRTRVIDVGEVVGVRCFGNGIGIGFDAVVNMFSDRITWLRGHPVYLLAVLRTILFYYRAPQTRIEGDGFHLEQPTLMVSVMNGRRMGGGFLMAPEARPDDGLFDLCVGAQMGRLRMLSLVPHFIRGTQAGRPRIATGRSPHVRIEVMGKGQVVHADGETIATEARELEVRLLPRFLRVVV